MDFTKPIAYNGLTVNGLTLQAGGVPSSGYVLDEFDPSLVDVAAFLDKRALQDGVDASDIYLGARHIGLVVSVYGSSKGDFWDKAQDLLAAFSPTLAYSADTANLGFSALTFYQPTADISTWPTSAYPSGIPLQYYVRPVAPPKYTQRRDEDGGAASRGLSKQFRIAMLARDPRKYVQTAISSSITTAVANASYRGDYPVWPIVTFSLSATGHSAFRLFVRDGSVIINLSGTSSGTYTLDYAKRTLVDSNGTSFASLFTTTNFFQIESGHSTFWYANATGISSATLTYREAFV